MTISDNNIIKRWNTMANTDLGYNVQPIALSASVFFKKVFEENKTQFDYDGMTDILSELRGFLINNYYDDCSVIDTLDLGYINMTKECARDFDWWLMIRKDWVSKYHYAIGLI